MVPAVPRGWGGIALSYAIWLQSPVPPQLGHAGGEQALPMSLFTLSAAGGVAPGLSAMAYRRVQGGLPWDTAGDHLITSWQ